MRKAHCAWAPVAALMLFGCSGDTASPVSPTGEQPDQLRAAVHQASGGYHFLVPADFNGGIFGGAVGNRVTFHAARTVAGEVSGSWNYEQTDFGTAGIPYTYKGSVTCFKVYDTPVLQRFPDVPPMTGNRAKWGGPIGETTDPTVPVGTFAWFQSIDNGEGANEGPDVSTLFGLGDGAANEAFCNSPNVPNPNFGPHAVQGNIQVR